MSEGEDQDEPKVEKEEQFLPGTFYILPKFVLIPIKDKVRTVLLLTTMMKRFHFFLLLIFGLLTQLSK